MRQLNSTALEQLFENGYRNLKRNVDKINDLNVFPVPDGDTGTNMLKTFGGGLNAVKAGNSNVSDYAENLSRAVLMSARGNSGVILSQFISGFARGLKGKSEIAFSDMAYAFECATEDAYKSIITPTEGTILTVIREASDFLKTCSCTDFEEGFAALIAQMKDTLSRTPDMLPVLKQANVVDSGGAGLICIFEGMYACLCGKTLDDTADFDETISVSPVLGSFGPDSVLEYGYCTEFILQLMHAKTDIDAFDLNTFVAPLKELGDSIVAVCNGDIVKIHIHSFTPEKVLAYGRQFGEFVTLKIENMSVQHSETQAEESQKAEKEHLKYAIVSVASGSGIIDYFYSIGASVVIDGGQTNNPSVEAFMSAFESLDAEHIVVLPNNSNVILTANQAAELYNGSDVRVIPTKSIVEGYSALSMMNLWCDTVDELIEDMTSCLSGVITAQLTTATRDAVIDGISVKKDNYIGISGKTILSCDINKITAVTEMIKNIEGVEDKEVITIFYGADVSDSEVEALTAFLSDNYPLADIGFIDGKQDIYSFIISLE